MCFVGNNRIVTPQTFIRCFWSKDTSPYSRLFHWTNCRVSTNKTTRWMVLSLTLCYCSCWMTLFSRETAEIVRIKSFYYFFVAPVTTSMFINPARRILIGLFLNVSCLSANFFCLDCTSRRCLFSGKDVYPLTADAPFTIINSLATDRLEAIWSLSMSFRQTVGYNQTWGTLQ